jgi:hypothetical protein
MYRQYDRYHRNGERNPRQREQYYPPEHGFGHGQPAGYPGGYQNGYGGTGYAPGYGQQHYRDDYAGLYG